MQKVVKITFILSLSALFLGACSSNQATSGKKTKIDLYLLYRMQENTMGIYEISEYKAMDLKESQQYEPDNGKKKKMIELSLKCEQFDSSLEKLINKIETTKMEIMKEVGIDLNRSGTIKYEQKSIITRYQFIDADPNKSISTSFDFKKIGEELCELRYAFRKDALSVLLEKTLDRDNKPFTFKDPNIRSEDSYSNEFLTAIENSFEKMKINPEDYMVSQTVYTLASPNESLFKDAFKENLSWIEQFSLLEDQKQQLLDIRKIFFAHIASKVSLAKMVDFNSIVAVSEGNEYVKGGSNQTFKVFIAGVNTLEQPIVSGNYSSIEVKDGIANVNVVIPKGALECVYAGTISIRDKTGQVIQRKWSKKFVISK